MGRTFTLDGDLVMRGSRENINNVMFLDGTPRAELLDVEMPSGLSRDTLIRFGRVTIDMEVMECEEAR